MKIIKKGLLFVLMLFALLPIIRKVIQKCEYENFLPACRLCGIY